MSAPLIEVDEDLVDGIGVRFWVTQVGQPTKESLVLSIDDVRTLRAHLEDALDEYARIERLRERDPDGECLRGEMAAERVREEMAEARRLK